MLLPAYASAFWNLWFPDLCMSCRRSLANGETDLCFSCISEMPRTFFHLDPENPVAQRFWGRIPLQHAASFLHFTKGGMVQRLMHDLKYREKSAIGTKFGKLYAQELTMPGSLIKGIDAIVPVPLHWKRQRERGYNQCDIIAEGMSEVMSVPVFTKAIERRVENISQTHFDRFGRWKNVEDIFRVKQPELLEGRHILLLDDTITTGATLEACGTGILAASASKLSLAAIASAGTI